MATRTGRTTVCRTVAALVDAVAAEVTTPVSGSGPLDVVQSMIVVRAASRGGAPT